MRIYSKKIHQSSYHTALHDKPGEDGSYLLIFIYNSFTRFLLYDYIRHNQT